MIASNEIPFEDGFLQEIQFDDLFEIKDIEHIQDLFAQATGVASIITRPDGTPITRPSNFCRLCSDIIRKTTLGQQYCFKSDAVIGRHNPSGPIVQQCLSGGLWDAGASISVRGKHIANWLIGQVKNDDQDEQRMLLFADEIGADRDEFIQALAEVPVMSKEKFEKVAAMLFAFANELSSKAYEHKQLEHAIALHKQAAAKLLESEMKYRSLSESLKITEHRSRALIENAPDGIVMIDQTGRFTYVSPPAIRMFGYSIAEISLLHPDELTHPDELPMVLETMGRLFQDPACVPTIQYRFRHKNGNWFWIESTFSNLLETLGIESIVINFRDITDRKFATDKLLESEQQSRKLSRGIEQSPAAVVITDTAGSIEYVNPVFTTMTGYSLERVKGKIARILKPDRTPEEVHQRIWKTILSGKVWTGEYLSKKMNGQPYWESVSVAPIQEPQGGITDFIITMEDISERKKMISELIDARRKAEESDQLKSTFLANMSHEIRTPMNAIVGFAEMLTDPSLSVEDRARYSQIVQSRSDDLMHIINDLLEISRIESGNITVNKSEFSINEVLGDIGIVFVQHLEQLKRTNLTIHLDTALPDKLSVIESDIYIFKQVISNLIENAIKYTHSGSIHFGYLPPVKNEVTFYIKDTGIGISTENQAVIFEHFRQADIENRSQYGGTGLGLAICKGALAHIGGKIWVESKSGEGSVFYFTLPFHQRDSDTGGNQSLVHEGILNEKPGNHCTWPGKHILIVEDEQTNMEFLKIILGKTQVDITSAENALTLRNHYQKLDQFDLVLLDVRLPDASGWDLAREIKAIVPGLPVIAQTAYAMSSDLQKSMSAGCDNFISKPINKAKLLTMLSEYLG